jgi:hypothetical protein
MARPTSRSHLDITHAGNWLGYLAGIAVEMIAVLVLMGIALAVSWLGFPLWGR